ncbi:MAG TPA: hypothetical protein PL151_16100 [Phycisphaerae bacterium]|nr:hypothetical protein [Phycisphaerae bacterium]HOJ72875.1 hypothetical protein [Phycisphaerae bacterium]HOM50059.1 hypothetical protein [Phycisphaerae bacterium]HON68257.1 hypothetical protein [Phycisphaerae bacterium]HOQ86999.1 hypothetical protein [Phycisphaerae bacterium]
MLGKMGYYMRWAMLMGSGAMVFQGAGSCWDPIQTGLLAFLAGTTFFLARNV